MTNHAIGGWIRLFLGLSCLWSANVWAMAAFVDGEVIVKLSPGTTLERARSELEAAGNVSVVEALVPDLGIFLARTRSRESADSAVARLRSTNAVQYAQLNHRVQWRQVVPNDEQFTRQWSLSNLKTGADIRAPLAWDAGTGGKDRDGNELVIAIVDGGVDITHKDLVENIWINKGEIPGNGIDDDGNGFIDDVNGWNAFAKNGKIPPENHGTHVAGIAGARGNNGFGVAGVNWEVKILSVAAASSSTAVVVAGYNYVLTQKKLWLETAGKKGANIVVTNSSFGVNEADCTSKDFPLWNDIYNAMGSVGILSAAATANANVDVDVKGDVPTGCSSEYLISVTNTDERDARFPQSGYGKKHIHLGAPGTNILSTTPANSVGIKTGCSMSSPHVAGAVAFLHSVGSREFRDLVVRDPGKDALALKSVLLSSTERVPSLRDITVSGGRLNLARAGEALGRFPK